jgi:hypothetical protein
MGGDDENGPIGTSFFLVFFVNECFIVYIHSKLQDTRCGWAEITKTGPNAAPRVVWAIGTLFF